VNSVEDTTSIVFMCGSHFFIGLVVCTAHTLLVSAVPANLECGTDATTRLKVNATVMQGRVVAGGAEDGVSVVVDSDNKGAEITAPRSAKYFFAARLLGGVSQLAVGLGVV
jgi:hypothetical protein